jgi:hypothetical protein
MLDRQMLEAILRRRFADATDQAIASAANAIMGLVTTRPCETISAISRERWIAEQRSRRYADERCDGPTG